MDYSINGKCFNCGERPAAAFGPYLEEDSPLCLECQGALVADRAAAALKRKAQDEAGVLKAPQDCAAASLEGS